MHYDYSKQKEEYLELFFKSSDLFSFESILKVALNKFFFSFEKPGNNEQFFG